MFGDAVCMFAVCALCFVFCCYDCGGAPLAVVATTFFSRSAYLLHLKGAKPMVLELLWIFCVVIKIMCALIFSELCTRSIIGSTLLALSRRSLCASSDWVNKSRGFGQFASVQQHRRIALAFAVVLLNFARVAEE
eukprot:m.44516 g.44516  ORF g.44516 m.44516 type:complete len:135 (-) comp10923_c0_seq1:424-828(-)